MEREHDHIDLIEVIHKTDLLQSGEIKPASEILNPETLTEKELLPMVCVATLYCISHHFNAVAYTQFPDQIYDHVNAKKDLNNIIYVGFNNENDPLNDLIVINPHISFLEKNRFHISIEGCGSLEMGRIRMAIKRPNRIKLSGYFWKIGMELPQTNTVELSNWPSSMIQHESDHLIGKDATFFPERILDITNLNKSFFDNSEWSATTLKRSLISLFKNDGCEYLINKNGKLLLVNYKGETIKEYRK
jgi:peptide deformylase